MSERVVGCESDGDETASQSVSYLVSQSYCVYPLYSRMQHLLFSRPAGLSIERESSVCVWPLGIEYTPPTRALNSDNCQPIVT